MDIVASNSFGIFIVFPISFLGGWRDMGFGTMVQYHPGYNIINYLFNGFNRAN
jgi:hypothetical protein